MFFANLYIDFFLMCLAFCFALALIKYCNAKFVIQETGRREQHIEKLDPPPSYDEIMKLERKCPNATANSASPLCTTTD